MGSPDDGVRRNGRTVLVAVAIAALGSVLLIGGCERRPVDDAAPQDDAGADAGPATIPAPAALPSYWIETDYASWIGKRWDEVELLGYLERPPRDIDTGTRYVVFYSRTCDHCETMFQEDLARDATLAASVTAVEIPADKDMLTSPDAWPMPETACEHMSLPLGVNWIITPPLAVRLENGVVACAAEREHKGCLGLE